MKRRIFLVAVILLWALGVNAQTIINTGGATTVYKEQGGRMHDSLMAVPKVDTTRGKAYCSGCRTIGRVVVASDSNLYYHNGILWKKLSNQSTDTSSLSTRIDLKADKATTISTTYPISGGGSLAANRTFALDTTLWRSTGYNDTRYSPLAGSTSLTTLGTITTGTWNGSLITGTYGGTGVNNGSKTLMLSGNTTIGSSTHTVAFATSGNTSVTLPTSGTLINKTTTMNANFLAKSTADGTIANSLIRDDGSSVAINNAPLGGILLYVNGVTYINGTTTFNGNTTTTNGIYQTFATTGASKISGSSSTGDFRFQNETGGYYFSFGYIRSSTYTPFLSMSEGTGTRVKVAYTDQSDILWGTTTVSTDAAVNIVSTDKGVLIPRMTTTQRTAISATEGLMVYDTTLHKLYVFDGTIWQAAW